MVRQASASWVENLGPGQFGLLRGNVQDTNNVVLAPTLLFQVGGNSSVRGYDVGVLSGDTGYLMSMEFHRTLANGIGGYLFHDYGSVRTRDLPRESAHSVGAGLEAQSGSVSGNVVAGYALNRVQPDQRHWRVTAELSYAF
jgi:hemolysin activation/secretion protein